MRVGLDTNVLIYATDSMAEPRKREIAVDLVNRVGTQQVGILALQALSEFYAASTKKAKVPPMEAAAYVAQWSTSFIIVTPTTGDLDDAIRVVHHYGIAFWDSMMWAVLKRGGAQVILSEDMQDGRKLEGVEFLNPFDAGNARRLQQFLS